MIKGAENQEKYPSHLKAIKDNDCQQAFHYMIGSAATMPGFECFPTHHGIIPDFQYHNKDECLFAFIPNQQWLLFYFRKPALKRPQYSRETVLKRFPDAKENKNGEITLRVSDIDQAIKLAEFLSK